MFEDTQTYEESDTDAIAEEVREIEQVGCVARHAQYEANYGRLNDPGKHLNPITPNSPVLGPSRQPAPVKRSAFPDAFAAFEAAVTGKAKFVRGYTRSDGKKVAGYWRRVPEGNGCHSHQ